MWHWRGHAWHWQKYRPSVYKVSVQKKVKQCWMIMKLEEKVRWIFRPTLPFWTEVQRWTNHAWHFQCDFEVHEVARAHCRASARWAFVVTFLFRKWPIISIEKTIIPRLGSCRALWSCIWTFNPLAAIEVHYIEKNPGVLSSKNSIYFWLKKERHEHFGWHGESKLSGRFYSGSVLIL